MLTDCNCGGAASSLQETKQHEHGEVVRKSKTDASCDIEQQGIDEDLATTESVS